MPPTDKSEHVLVHCTMLRTHRPDVVVINEERTRTVFPETVLLADDFWLRKVTTDLHLLADVNIVSG